MTDSAAKRSPGAKMMYLIKRRPGVTRDELVMHWFANHMPAVIASQHEAAATGRMHAHRYIATLFDAAENGAPAWDGVAQLWWDAPLPKPKVPTGTRPRDSFQQKAEPYVGWATAEYVALDGSERLPVEPLTLNAPFPCTRSGFFKVTFLVKTRPDIVYQELFDHWLTVHVPNVQRVMRDVGGFRYVVSHSIEPESEPYAGMAELYFPDAAAWAHFSAELQPDGIERWLDPRSTLRLNARTEMIGIP
jgi:EthD domain